VLPSSKEPIKIHPASWMLLAPLVPQEVVAEVQLCQEPAAGTEVLYNFDCIWEVTETVLDGEGLAFPVELLRAHQIC
jgi:hypothetical protein